MTLFQSTHVKPCNGPKSKPVLKSLFLRLSLTQAFAVSAFAMDLGHPLMLSNQGEPLKIEIPLSTTNPEELKSLQVGIAPLSTYQSKQLGDDAAFLSAIGAQARLAKNSKGSNIIAITSDKPSSQTFLSLLIDLQWSSGSELKEIGVLLDANKRALTPKDSSIVVNAGDTASAIAKQYATAPITYEQMLLALLKANPKSFVNQNINRLRADAVLRIPSNAEASSINLPQAREELKAQNLDFENYRQSLAAKIRKSSANSINPTQQSATGLISPKAQAPSPSNQDQLKLSKPNSKGAIATEQTAKELQTEQNLKEAKQVNQNIKELGQIAEQNKGAEDQAGVAQEGVPSLKSRISQWLQNPLAPIVGGSLFGFLVLLSLWKTRDRQDGTTGSGESIDPLSRPSSIFDIDTPIPSSLRVSPQPIKPLGPNVFVQKDKPFDEDELKNPKAGEQANMTSGSLKDHVNLDFDLDLPDHESAEDHQNTALDPADPSSDSDMPAENPLQVRFDLAQELWQVGQQHTARAIVQEVVQQASGELLQQAQDWLTERG